MFQVKAMIGPFARGWLLPNAKELDGGSPVFGKPALMSVQPGAYSSAVPGSVNFVVPNYTTMSITLRAAGGGGAVGGGGTITSPAANGENSRFNLNTASPPGSYGPSMVATGGLAGVISGGPPAGQGGSGGTVTAGGGGAGGQGIDFSNGAPNNACSGSPGGRVTMNWNRTDAGAPLPGSVIMIYLGNGGAPATNSGAGSQNYNPGSFTFVVPAYSSLIVQVYGPGGGGAAGAGYIDSGGTGLPAFGTNGGGGSGNSSFGGVAGGPGGGGIASSLSGGPAQGGAGGAGGGSTNIAGAGAGGGAGGGSAPDIGMPPGGGGGPGGYASFTYSPGQLTVSGSVSVTVGSGGGGGAPATTSDTGTVTEVAGAGTRGSDGLVSISWVAPISALAGAPGRIDIAWS